MLLSDVFFADSLISILLIMLARFLRKSMSVNASILVTKPASPVCSSTERFNTGLLNFLAAREILSTMMESGPQPKALIVMIPRSEERRVGKECRL